MHCHLPATVKARKVLEAKSKVQPQDQISGPWADVPCKTKTTQFVIENPRGQGPGIEAEAYITDETHHKTVKAYNIIMIIVIAL